MCDAPSTWRASGWVTFPSRRRAAENGVMGAPGEPNAWVTPSRRSTATAASAAVILGMSPLLTDEVLLSPAGELFGELEQAGMVEATVAAGDEGGDQLGDGTAE